MLSFLPQETEGCQEGSAHRALLRLEALLSPYQKQKGPKEPNHPLKTINLN